MARNYKNSPLKLISGAIDALAAYDWGGKRKKAIAEAQDEYDTQKRAFMNLDTSNLYGDVSNPYANMQNTMEDLTVNQQQAQFEAEQAAQSRANVLDSLRGAAGPSGIAGLAQSLANQATADRARASASIGQQESRNQALAARGAESVSRREQAAQQTVMEGEAQRQAQERQRDLQIMQLEAGKQDALAGLRQQRAAAISDIVGGIGTMAGSAFDAYELGIGTGNTN